MPPEVEVRYINSVWRTGSEEEGVEVGEGDRKAAVVTGIFTARVMTQVFRLCHPPFFPPPLLASLICGDRVVRCGVPTAGYMGLRTVADKITGPSDLSAGLGSTIMVRRDINDRRPAPTQDSMVNLCKRSSPGQGLHGSSCGGGTYQEPLGLICWLWRCHCCGERCRRLTLGHNPGQCGQLSQGIHPQPRIAQVSPQWRTGCIPFNGG